jgi:hypothetical protein
VLKLLGVARLDEANVDRLALRVRRASEYCFRSSRRRVLMTRALGKEGPPAPL